MENKKTNLPWEVKASLERVLAEKGYLPEQYVNTRTLVETTVGCPLCGNNLVVECEGNSYVALQDAWVSS